MWRPITIRVHKRPWEQVRGGHTTRGGSTSRPFFDPLNCGLPSATDPTVDLAEVNSIQWAVVGLLSSPITENEEVDDYLDTAIIDLRSQVTQKTRKYCRKLCAVRVIPVSCTHGLGYEAGQAEL